METRLDLSALRLSIRSGFPVWFDNDYCDGLNWVIFPVHDLDQVNPFTVN